MDTHESVCFEVCPLLLRSIYNNFIQDNPSTSYFCSGGLWNSPADSCHPSYRGSSHGWQSASRVVRVGSTMLDMHIALKGHLVQFIFPLKTSPKQNPSRRVPRRAMPSTGSYRSLLVTRVAQLKLGHVFGSYRPCLSYGLPLSYVHREYTAYVAPGV